MGNVKEEPAVQPPSNPGNLLDLAEVRQRQNIRQSLVATIITVHIEARRTLVVHPEALSRYGSGSREPGNDRCRFRHVERAAGGRSVSEAVSADHQLQLADVCSGHRVGM